MGNILEIRNLCKTFGEGTTSQVQVLKGIDLDIKEGEFVVITGQSGSGISTIGEQDITKVSGDSSKGQQYVEHL